MATPVYSNDTYYEVYGQNIGRVSRENFVQFRPHIPRKRKSYRDDGAKARAWSYAVDLVAMAEREGADPGYAFVWIRFHEPGTDSVEVWRASANDERWKRMLATSKTRA